MNQRSIWHLVVLLGLTGQVPAANVVINEIHYKPDDKTVAEEFVEIHNRGRREADLSGWFFSDGISYIFPEGTTLAPGGFLVLAEDPETLAESFGLEGVLGPYEGRISNDGEALVLRNGSGGIEDVVDFQVRFPWPLASAGRGSSMELIHPALDNDLGGSWRASGLVPGPPVVQRDILASEDPDWHYRKGTSEPSDPPSAWREREFVEDETWLVGQTSIGFGDDDDRTVLDDMRENYTSVYLRHGFVIESDEDIPRLLKLRLYVDDGVIVWINGVEVTRFQVDEGEIPFDGHARRSTEARWSEILLPGPSRFLVAGENLLAIHAMNFSLRSADFSIDAALQVPDGSELDTDDLLAPPTPGAINSVFSEVAPPQVRQVNHGPRQPASGEAFAVTVKVTDPEGVSSVEVRYQVVSPGNYIPAFDPLPHNVLLSNPGLPRSPNPEFADPANWTTIAMRDDGSGSDARAGDSIYAATIPPQENRTLVRYRITATDASGLSLTVPNEDDRSLNFGCFVYDGVPPYVASTRSVHPEGPGHVYSVELMNSLPVYFLLTRESDLQHCIAYNSSFNIPKSNEGARDKFNWEGTFVYQGVVYDHMRYRLRQANDRYGGRGKRSMRFRFNKGSYAELRDNYGQKYPSRWRTINTGKMFDNKRVGNFGLTETLNHDLWNLVGVPAPVAHTFHLRVIDAPEEAPEGTSGQFLGDFWGMFLVFEDYDARFVDAHGLEDGNLYKLKDGIFNGNLMRRNQGRFAVKTDADFQNIRRNLRPQRPDEWLDAHVNYDRWYPYHAVVEGIRHYDFRPSDTHSKNRAWYFEPQYEGSPLGRLWTLPWDSDASWGPNWNDGIDYSKNAIFASGGKPAFKQKYRNFIREFRDLIWTEEAIHLMIDDLAAFVTEFSMADRDRWRGAPSVAGSQDFGPIERKIVDMKNFAFRGWSGSTGPTVPAGGRARHLDNLANAGGDAVRIPETPVVTWTGPEGFPLDSLTFESSPFGDPEEEDQFTAMMWRVGEITPSGVPFDPGKRRNYEWEAAWESGELTAFSSTVTIPPLALRVGHTYRTRVKMMDSADRWSHWSDPVEFTVGEPALRFPVVDGLRITEIMYHPRGDEGYEFIDLLNISSETLDLRGVHLRNGIRFAFEESDVRSLEPGEYVVVVKNRAVFETRYDVSEVRIAGEYSGRLSNAGERIELAYGDGVSVLDFAYDDTWHPLTDGGGVSLVIRDAGLPRNSWGDLESWRPSHRRLGSPGTEDRIVAEGLHRPGNVNQDGSVNITDAIHLLRFLFGSMAVSLPCGDGTLEEQSNRLLLDIDGDRNLGLADVTHLLSYLFQGGPPPALGTECVVLPACPDSCGP